MKKMIVMRITLQRSDDDDADDDDNGDEMGNCVIFISPGFISRVSPGAARKRRTKTLVVNDAYMSSVLCFVGHENATKRTRTL